MAAPAAGGPWKIPESVLVVIHSAELEVLLLERADRPGFWQSVTGSKDTVNEPLVETCTREVAEETGLLIGAAELPAERLCDWCEENVYTIYPQWRHRYAPGVMRNTEHVFSLCVNREAAIRLSPREHVRFEWLAWPAAAERCFSASNAAAIRKLPRGMRAR